MTDDDFLAAGRAAMAIVEQLLDHPTDLSVANAAVRQFINDYPECADDGRRLLALFPAESFPVARKRWAANHRLRLLEFLPGGSARIRKLWAPDRRVVIR